MKATLRPYQEEAISALWACWRKSASSKPLIVCPTGAGKSLIIAEIVRRATEKRPSLKTLVVSHRKEIIEQNAEALSLQIGAPVGIYSAGLGRRDFRRITCANIQSIYKKPLEADLLIIDEAHLLSTNSKSMYQKLVKGLGTDCKVMGLTATPMRMDQGELVGPFFSEVAYDIEIRRLIDEGYLSKLISRATLSPLDFSGVGRSGYDYNIAQMEELLCPHTPQHVAEIQAKTVGRKHILCFCAGVKHAKELCEEFTRQGVAADYVTGDMLGLIRDSKINRFKRGDFRVLCNCDILTTGFNFPALDCICLVRATRSTSLYIQIVGRGCRTSPGKEDCLVLDFGGNIERHGPVDFIKSIRGGKEGKEKGKVPFKMCPSCGVALHISIAECPSCGFIFPAIKKLLEEKASSASILYERPKPEIFSVDGIDCHVREKEGKPPMFVVVYHTSKGKVTEYLCFEHSHGACRMAQKKWVLLGGKLPAPNTSQEADDRYEEIIAPESIEAVKENGFWRVVKIIGEKKENSEEKSARSYLEDLGIL